MFNTTSQAQSVAVHSLDPAEDSQVWFRQLTDEIILTASGMNALEFRFIELISEYDEYELWRVADRGIKNFANWLNVNCGIHPLVAREKIRVARHLRNLPLINQAFGAGVVSYSKVRALTRVATPQNESLLLEDARSMTAAQLELRVRRFRKVKDVDPYVDSDNEDYDAEPESCVKCWRDEDGYFHLHARLLPEDGALVENAIERMVTKGSSNEPDPLPASYVQEEIAPGKDVPAETNPGGSSHGSSNGSFGQRRARALTNIAEHFLATAKDGAQGLAGSDKSHIIVHVNANAAHRDCQINQGECTFLDKGEFLTPTVAQRLACDASVTTVVEDDTGSVLNIGRRSKVVTRAIDLAVDIRDNFTCQHPWCHQTRHTHKHHIKHWAAGGETSAPNLITLCGRHHTLIHEGNFHIETVDGVFKFIDRHGEIINPCADPQFPQLEEIRDELKQQFEREGGQELVPVTKLDLPAILGRRLTADERRRDYNRRWLAALKQLYSTA